MNPNFDPYREALVVETETIWPEEFAGAADAERRQIEAGLHATPQQAAQMEYVRLPTGFCRRITVTADDLKRIQERGTA